ncbi:MAG: methyltransferase regulatory domain-containing protein [Myxococcales bacterium]|nr:methyltransferase regulatory domain-containing protein [Myxococcales bacterium]
MRLQNSPNFSEIDPSAPAIGVEPGSEVMSTDSPPPHSDELRHSGHSESDPLERDYDALPYDGGCFEHTHPARLAVVARLFGLAAPPVETARVLELGCASGENLIPMAAQFPHATFVGADLSARQVEDGRRHIAALGLGNIRLERVDILDMTDDVGVYDYILCHGVYSWVPDVVRSKIMEIVRRHLAPDGVAYVSYNVHPGSYQRLAARELMLFAAQGSTDPRERLKTAKDVLSFVGGTMPIGSASGQSLRSIVDTVTSSTDSYVFHEYLEPYNRPLWFHEFWSHLVGNELTYVADSHFGNILLPDVTDEAARKLRELAPDRLRLEQYLDFYRNQTFRRSIVAQGARSPNAEPSLDAIESLYVSADVQAAQGGERDIGTPATMVFVSARGQELRTNDPLEKAILWELGDVFPRAIETPTLRRRAARRVSSAVAEHLGPERPQVGRLVLRLAAEGAVELHLTPLAVAVDVAERPRASAIARYMAAIGPDVPNYRHQQFVLSEIEREVLVLLDGSRTLADVASEIRTKLRRGETSISRDGVRVDYETLHPMVPRLVEMMAQVFLRQSLLLDDAPAGLGADRHCH